MYSTGNLTGRVWTNNAMLQPLSCARRVNSLRLTICNLIHMVRSSATFFMLVKQMKQTISEFLLYYYIRTSYKVWMVRVHHLVSHFRCEILSITSLWNLIWAHPSPCFSPPSGLCGEGLVIAWLEKLDNHGKEGALMECYLHRQCSKLDPWCINKQNRARYIWRRPLTCLLRSFQ